MKTSLTAAFLLILFVCCLMTMDSGLFTAAQTTSNFHLSILQSTINQAMPSTLIVTAKDQNNNTQTNYSGTFSLTSSDPKTLLPTNPTLSLTNGIGSYTIYFGTSGTQTITATDTTNNQITGSISALVLPIHFSLTSSPSTITVGSYINVMVTALDSSNNVLTDLGKQGYGASLEFSSSDPQAQFPPQGSGSNLVNGVGTFRIILLTSGSQTVTVTNKAFNTIKAQTNTVLVNPLPTIPPTPPPKTPTPTPTTAKSPTSQPQTPNPTNTTNPTPTSGTNNNGAAVVTPKPGTTFTMNTPVPFTIPQSEVILIAAGIAIAAIVGIIAIVIYTLEKNSRASLEKKKESEEPQKIVLEKENASEEKPADI